MARLTVFGAFLACIAIASLAQEAPQAAVVSEQPAVQESGPPITLIPRSHEERESRYRAQHRVILNALVTDASGKPVTGLQQEDFALLVDREPRPLFSFRAAKGSTASERVHVILMLDAVNNSPRRFAHEHKEMERYLAKGERLTYPTSIGVLTNSGARIGQPLQERMALAGELEEFTKDLHIGECPEQGRALDPGFAWAVSGSAGTNSRMTDSENCQNERFKLSVSALNKLALQQGDVPGRVLLIWIGAGWPELSGPGFSPDTIALKQNFFDNLVELTTALREGQVTLDAVDSLDSIRGTTARYDADNAFYEGLPTEDKATAASLALQALAHQSGGQILKESTNLGVDIDKCIADVELYYVLSFDFAPAARPGEFHALQVNVVKPGLTVRTNTVYYAEP